MAAVLNEESVEKKLKTVINTQDSIQTLSLWIIHHKNHHAKIVELWLKVLKKTVQPSHRLILFYLCNDVVQTCKKKNANVYNHTFKESLLEAAALVRDHTIKGKVERIFNIWEERGVYNSTFIKRLHSILGGQPVKSPDLTSLKNVGDLDPVSPTRTPLVEFSSTEEAVEQQPNDTYTELDEEESARILAEFKPHEMIDQIKAFRKKEAQLRLKVGQLPPVKLDVSNAEVIRQLKDRAHGSDLSHQLDDSTSKLADLISKQASYIEDHKSLLETLRLSETFYEEQYREAKIVANAYKNFGARINNMKKKLDDIKRTLPAPVSPVPSPDANAPSPGSTPPYAIGLPLSFKPAASSAISRLGSQQTAWIYNGTAETNMSVNSPSSSDSPPFQDTSPPLEAPSPDGTPDINRERSEKVNVSLDSRLASFFDRNRTEASNPPVYTPQLIRPAGSSINKLKLTGADNDGSTTPLKDETPTTPVQDENLISPPKRITPPKKENPIDFLSRLISQTQKAPVKAGVPSFLDTVLSVVTKKPDSESQPPPPAGPSSWATWKLQASENESSSNQTTSLLPYAPSQASSSVPAYSPSVASSTVPAYAPSVASSTVPAYVPSVASSSVPSYVPNQASSTVPAYVPSIASSSVPSYVPSQASSTVPAYVPSVASNTVPAYAPSQAGSSVPAYAPSQAGSTVPAYIPSVASSSVPAPIYPAHTAAPPPIPMPVPPPITAGIVINVPPPPLPPFSLTSPIPTTFTSPAPLFQATSPMQREAWPELNTASKPIESLASGVATNSSVLKELAPAELVDIHLGPMPPRESSASVSVIDSNNDETVSDEEMEEKDTPRSGDAIRDAKTEFAEKLKQKTSQPTIKSHVFVPFQDRPNVITLTGSDIQEVEMEEEADLLEKTPVYSDKSHKSSHRSRSRSKSRDKAHKHKKKKKHKHSHSSGEDSRHSGSDRERNKSTSSVGSVVKKVDSHSSRHSRDSSKGDKHDDRKLDKYDRYDRYDRHVDDRRYQDQKYDDKKYEDKKYDRFDNKGYVGGGAGTARLDYKPSYPSLPGSKDINDPVQAYTQAYKDALFQQYSMARLNFVPQGPAPLDPRRSGYGKF